MVGAILKEVALPLPPPLFISCMLFIYDPDTVQVACLRGQVEGRHPVPVPVLPVHLVPEEPHQLRVTVQGGQVQHRVTLLITLLTTRFSQKVTRYICTIEAVDCKIFMYNRGSRLQDIYEKEAVDNKIYMYKRGSR